MISKTLHRKNEVFRNRNHFEGSTFLSGSRIEPGKNPVKNLSPSIDRTIIVVEKREVNKDVDRQTVSPKILRRNAVKLDPDNHAKKKSKSRKAKSSHCTRREIFTALFGATKKSNSQQTLPNFDQRKPKSKSYVIITSTDTNEKMVEERRRPTKRAVISTIW